MSITRSPGALAALENAREAVEYDHVRIRLESEERDAYNRFWRALMLSPDLETCEALLRGEDVPADRLDPEWLARFRRQT
jgi:hypothetical protein